MSGIRYHMTFIDVVTTPPAAAVKRGESSPPVLAPRFLISIWQTWDRDGQGLKIVASCCPSCCMWKSKSAVSVKYHLLIACFWQNIVVVVFCLPNPEFATLLDLVNLSNCIAKIIAWCCPSKERQSRFNGLALPVRTAANEVAGPSVNESC